MPVGRPFQPGQSGNPSGRPKTPAEFRALNRKVSMSALRALHAQVKGGGTEPEDLVAILAETSARAGDLTGKEAADLEIQRWRVLADLLKNESLTTEQRTKILDDFKAKQKAAELAPVKPEGS